jgi:hypothetical protein
MIRSNRETESQCALGWVCPPNKPGPLFEDDGSDPRVAFWILVAVLIVIGLVRIWLL